MNREIKFRAWDKYREEWIPQPYVLHVYGTICLIQESGHFGYIGSSVEFLQYTGLKDKNDIEIYFDCSIIKPRVGSPYVVTWNDWSILNEIEAHPESYEVIGNIYEQSELMGETK